MASLKENEIRVCQVHIYETYAGLLLGRPNPEINKRIIGEASEKALKFGKPVYLIPPVLKYPDLPLIDPVQFPLEAEEYLPSYVVLADLESFASEGNYDGRSLAVVLFADEVFSGSINDIVDNAIKDLNWKEHSRLWLF